MSAKKYFGLKLLIGPDAINSPGALRKMLHVYMMNVKTKNAIFCKVKGKVNKYQSIKGNIFTDPNLSLTTMRDILREVCWSRIEEVPP